MYSFGKKLLKQESFDLVSSQDQYFVGFVACHLARKFKLGLEIQIHGFEKFYGLRKKISQRILPKADSVRVVSERLKDKLIKDFKVKESKITVVPIFVDTSHGLRKKDRGDKNFIFLSIGRLVEVKNFSLQLQAMKKVVQKFPQARLFILGKGPLEEQLKQEVKDLALEDFVEFKGWVDDINSYYQDADAFVLSSDSEGWGMVVVQAASFGLPIVMTDVGCAGEVIKDKESGLVVPVGDSKALTASMLKIIKDKDLRERLVQGAKEVLDDLPDKDKTFYLYKQSWQKAIKS
ncbi:hypothetical protein C0580_02765 [Candidatus Parcubacteria bacterium]|nr:MAG: hypothetical protein C0580_02765 [Candidatus Parcubacteria bacterium]